MAREDTLPVLRYLIACEDIQVDNVNPRRVTLVGVISAIRAKDEPPYPFLYKELCVFVQLTECQGAAEVEVRINQADSGIYVYSGPASPWRAALPNDPLGVLVQCHAALPATAAIEVE